MLTNIKEGMAIEPLDIAKKAVSISLDKKSMEPKILDISEISSIADFFVICGGNSDRHVKALLNEIELKLKEYGIRSYRREIDPLYQWCILDYGSVIIHIFYYKTRDYYKLESLWGDAKEVTV